MKLGNRNAEVVTNLSGKDVKFSIKASRKAMDTLSSSIYANVVAAVLRETACNAADAHAAAGKPDQPIRVHLPTENESVLVVQDWGTGLSADEVETLYTTYFESLSSESDEATGHFGLGSKSPFAYVDTFTITAIKDATLCIYQAYRDSENQPCARQVRKMATTEPNGVRIDIPVNLEDIEVFHREAARVFAAFRVRPDINVKKVREHLETLSRVERESVIDEGQGWKVFGTNHQDYGALGFLLPEDKRGFGEYRYIDTFPKALCVNGKEHGVVMLGDVAYPLEWDKIQSGRHDFSGALGVNIEHIGASLMLRLDLASEGVDLQPSRENLQYTERTCRVLHRAIARVIGEKRMRYESAVKGATEWERWRAAATRFDGMKWAATAAGITASDRFSLQDWNLPESVLDGVSIHQYRLSRRDSEASRLHPAPAKSADWRLWANDPLCVYVQDGGFAPRKRIEHDMRRELDAIRDNAKGGRAPGYMGAIVIRIPKGDEAVMRDAQRRLLSALGNPDFKRTSELEEPPEVIATKRERARQAPGADSGVGAGAAIRGLTAISASRPWHKLHGINDKSHLVELADVMSADNIEAFRSGTLRLPLFGLMRGRLVEEGESRLLPEKKLHPESNRLSDRLGWMERCFGFRTETLLALIRLVFPDQPVLCATASNRKRLAAMPNAVHPTDWLCERLDTLDWDSGDGRRARRLIYRHIRQYVLTEEVFKKPYISGYGMGGFYDSISERVKPGDLESAWAFVKRDVAARLGTLPAAVADFDILRRRVISVLSSHARIRAIQEPRLSLPFQSTRRQRYYSSAAETMCQIIALAPTVANLPIAKGQAMFEQSLNGLVARYVAPKDGFAERYPLIAPGLHFNSLCVRNPRAVADYIVMAEGGE